jgi:hypothetical protein
MARDGDDRLKVQDALEGSVVEVATSLLSRNGLRMSLDHGDSQGWHKAVLHVALAYPGILSVLTGQR